MTDVYSNPSGRGETIAKAIAYMTDRVDDILAHDTLTAAMEADPAIVRASQTAGTVEIFKLDFGADGALSDYSTAQGYVLGTATGTWQAFTCAHNEGKGFDLDGLTDDQTGGVSAAAYQIAAYTRKYIVPRIDQVRLDALKTAGATAGVTSATRLTKATIFSAIKTGLKTVFDNGGPSLGNTIYIPSTYSNLLETSSEITNTKDVRGGMRGITSAIDDIDGNPVVVIPDSYCTNLEFAICPPNTALGVADVRVKHVANEYNTRADGDFLGYHVYHDCFFPTNAAAATYSYSVSA